MAGAEAMRINPDFLHGNAMVHVWPFSAFAELIDNAYDASTKNLRIYKERKNGKECLIFLDDGCGMEKGELHKMMSLGYNMKYYHGKAPVGQFGIGFKSGSMRLGEDVLVFTKRENSASVGFLSQTLLKAIESEDVVIPILEYTSNGSKLEPVRTDHYKDNLTRICEYSPFQNEEEIKQQFSLIRANGTKIVIFELNKLQDDTDELDFTTDPNDIQLQHEDNKPKHTYSLREYCSILYYQPRMKIELRGIKVQCRYIVKSLTSPWTCTYQAAGRPKTNVTFGQTWESNSDNYGMMLYHNNRLIKAFEKLPCQKQKSPMGVGVVGVTQVNFADPTHNKQDFNQDSKLKTAMNSYNAKLKDYLDFLEKGRTLNKDETWVQCDDCKKWRKLHQKPIYRPDRWYCQLNPDRDHNNCSKPEEDGEGEAVPKPRVKARKRKSESPNHEPTSSTESACKIPTYARARKPRCAADADSDENTHCSPLHARSPQSEATEAVQVKTEHSTSNQIKIKPGSETEAESQVANLQRKYVGAQNEVANLQRKYAEAQNEVADLQKKYAEAESEIANLQGRLDRDAKAQSEVANLQRKYAEAQNEITNLQGRLDKDAKAQSEVANLQEKYAEAKNEVANLQGRLNKAAKAPSAVAYLQKKYAEAQIEITNLKGRLGKDAEAQCEVANLQRKYAEAQNEITNLQGRLDRAAEASNEVGNLQKKYAEAQNEITNLQGRLGRDAEAQSEVANLQKKYAEAQKEVANLQERLDRNAQVQSEVTNLRRRLSRVLSNIHRLLRFLAPDVGVENVTDIEQLIEEMLQDLATA